MQNETKRRKIAVIGAGISGITASYLLQQKYDVTLFESLDRLGGHTNTVSVPDEAGVIWEVDTGFIVLNDCNYPILHELFERWNVRVRWSDMSFSFFDPVDPFYYAGTTLFGLFSQVENALRPSFYRFLFEILRFCRDASLYLSVSSSPSRSTLFPSPGVMTELSLGEFLERGGYSIDMIECYLLPMGSAIWSVPTETIRDFPAESFFRFFRNHGLLGLLKRPRWQTVCGGSSAYLSTFSSLFKGEVLLGSQVENVRRDLSRSEGGVAIFYRDNKSDDLKEKKFDEVVFACHADQALNMIDSPTVLEKDLLGVWKYQMNEAILHTDSSILPPCKHAWASWNYYGRYRNSGLNDGGLSNSATLTYYMNLLQGLDSKTDFLVTLNDDRHILKDKILKRISYSHPVYTAEAVYSQTRLHELQGKNHSYFAGSYFGNGFHEDGARSGAQVALFKGVAL
ncbi:MAG TPA: FAD-dependent oxidoreductase [Oligoflexia bacterium]|nr:FAD-dependent oxidoreductase [Oligoflexia bacterium]HMP48476.1 FAD-dependent oxidoreductase [Oligoflexia bacterium]